RRGLRSSPSPHGLLPQGWHQHSGTVRRRGRLRPTLSLGRPSSAGAEPSRGPYRRALLPGRTGGAVAETIGVRLGLARRHRGLTQQGLATRCNYSRSQIAKVEAGHTLATPAFVAAVAAALGIDPAELYGQPYRGAGDEEQVHAPIAALRRALAFVDVPPDLQTPPRPLEALAAELAQCQRQRRAAHHTRLGARLPAVLEELT